MGVLSQVGEKRSKCVLYLRNILGHIPVGLQDAESSPLQCDEHGMCVSRYPGHDKFWSMEVGQGCEDFKLLWSLVTEKIFTELDLVAFAKSSLMSSLPINSKILPFKECAGCFP